MDKWCGGRHKKGMYSGSILASRHTGKTLVTCYFSLKVLVYIIELLPKNDLLQRQVALCSGTPTYSAPTHDTVTDWGSMLFTSEAFLYNKSLLGHVHSVAKG